MTLFLVKRGNYYPNAGLEQAAEQTAKAIGGRFRTVTDANGIDSLAAYWRPRRIVLEALWATPEKVSELAELHPNTEFVVRIHSQLDFLAEEGIAFDWLYRYECSLASNHYQTSLELTSLLEKQVMFLPNAYPVPDTRCGSYPGFHVSCFGASRPLKNQAVQAAAAILYAEESGRKLTFHMNTADTAIMRSIRGMFREPHILVEHPWLPHGEFLGLAAKMTVGMQASLSETYNYVSADHVWQHIPVCASKEITWAASALEDPTDVWQVTNELDRALNTSLVEGQMSGLLEYNRLAIDKWV